MARVEEFQISRDVTPTHQPPDGKGMAQIMKARCGMRAPIDPVEAIPKGIEDTMDLAIAERLPQPPTSAANEERGVGRRRYVVHTLSPVAR